MDRQEADPPAGGRHARAISSLKARVGEADEALRSAQARLELAQSESARVQALFERGVASKRQLDQVTFELRAAEASVRGLDEAREQSRTAFSFAEIRAPVGGRVVDRLPEPGARTLLVKVRLHKVDERLLAGLCARVAMPAGKRRRLLVPSGAVQEIGQLSYVDVMTGADERERRLVTTGRKEPHDRIEILSGLQPAEAVWVPRRSSSGAHPREPAASKNGGTERHRLG